MDRYFLAHDASRLSRVALNPQPLPPGGRVALNPQPLPPRAIIAVLIGL